MILLINKKSFIVSFFILSLLIFNLRFYSGNLELYDFGVFLSNLYSLVDNLSSFFYFDSFRITVIPIAYLTSFFYDYSNIFLAFLNSLIFTIPFFYVKKHKKIILFYIFFSFPIWFQIIHGFNVDTLGYIIFFYTLRAHYFNQNKLFYALVLILALTKEYYVFFSLMFLLLHFEKHKQFSKRKIIITIILLTIYLVWFYQFNFIEIYLDKISFKINNIPSTIFSLIVFYLLFVFFIKLKFQLLIYFPIIIMVLLQDIGLNYRFLNSHYLLPLVGLTHSFIILEKNLLISGINFKFIIILLMILTPLPTSFFFWTKTYTHSYHFSNYIIDQDHYKYKKEITKNIPVNSILAIQNYSIDYFSTKRKVIFTYPQIFNKTLTLDIKEKFGINELYVLIDENKMITKDESKFIDIIKNHPQIVLKKSQYKIHLYQFTF